MTLHRDGPASWRLRWGRLAGSIDLTEIPLPRLSRGWLSGSEDWVAFTFGSRYSDPVFMVETSVPALRGVAHVDWSGALTAPW